MKHPTCLTIRALPALAGTLLASGLLSQALADDPGAKVAQGASLVGGAVPGGAILSARMVTLTPAAGGNPVTIPIASDGSFKATGLKPGPYRLAISSGAGKQTQGATFGEKVNSGLASAGSAVAQGAALSTQGAPKSPTSSGRQAAPAEQASNTAPATQAAKSGINGINGGMPNRISMNVTVGRLTRPADVDGTPIDVEVAADGNVSGHVAPR